MSTPDTAATMRKIQAASSSRGKRGVFGAIKRELRRRSAIEPVIGHMKAEGHVYVMLFGLGLGGSLLAGFGMAAATARSWIHMVVFASTLTVALYTITDMEYPRLGLIRFEYFDHFLVDAHQQMQPRDSVGTIGVGR